MRTATTSVSMWPASASRAIELISSEVTSSTTKNAARIAAAMIMRGISRASSVSAGVWLWPAPMARNICAIAHIWQGSEPAAPEAGQRVAPTHQDVRHAGHVEQRQHDPEEPLVEHRCQEQEQQDDESPLLGRRQRALGFATQMRFQGVVSVQARKGQQVQQHGGEL